MTLAAVGFLTGPFPIYDSCESKNLACWRGPGVPCHVDVLLELANTVAAGR